VARAHAPVATGGLKLRKAGTVLESDADIEAQIQDRARFFFSEVPPFLPLLGAAS